MPVFDFITPALLVAIAVAAAAGLMRGFAGFGSGMLMAPIFAILFGPVETVAIVVLMEIFVSAQLLPRALGDIEWRFVASMAFVAAAFMPIGSLALEFVDPAIMTQAMAVVVLIFVLVLITGWRYRGQKRLAPTMAVGAMSGTLMAATSMGNPPVLIYMLSGPDTAVTNRANIIAYFAVTQVILLLVMTAFGLMSWSPVWRALIFAPGFMLAAWLGSRMFHKSGEALYRRIALAFLFCVGLYGLLRG